MITNIRGESMGFYDLNKQERVEKKELMNKEIRYAVDNKDTSVLKDYFADDDTYIRKVAYEGLTQDYFDNANEQTNIIQILKLLLSDPDQKVRQSVVYVCGGIAKSDLKVVEPMLDVALHDEHHMVCNAVTGALKASGEKNNDVILFCKQRIQDDNPNVRRLVCHGLELRGRKYPEDIVDILKLIQFDNNKRVMSMLVHVLGQISYKKGCLHYVSNQVKAWDNLNIYPRYVEEVIEVHGRYEKFSEFSQREVIEYFEVQAKE